MSQLTANPGTGAPPIETITGNSGGAVGPAVNGNINLTGDATTGITVTGTPGTNSLVISAADATTTQKGVVELATDAESISGASSSNLAIVPSSLKAKLGAQTLNSIPYGNSDSLAIQWIGPGTDGQLVIGATGAAPAFANLTSLDGSVTITNGANTIDLSSSAFGIMWTEVLGASQAMAVDMGYIANNAGLVTLTLPAIATVGDRVRVAGKGAGLFKIAQNVAQTIHFDGSDTTTGVLGSLTATNRYDCIELLCITANTDWVVLSVIGNLTVA